jgi:hypothetical protein
MTSVHHHQAMAGEGAVLPSILKYSPRLLPNAAMHVLAVQQSVQRRPRAACPKRQNWPICITEIQLLASNLWTQLAADSALLDDEATTLALSCDFDSE